MSIFEIGMLAGFGVAWPFSIYKGLKTRQTGGKSLVFLSAVWLGYLSGILHKVFFNMDLVIWFYVLNILMVTGDIIIFLINRRREKKGEKNV